MSSDTVATILAVLTGAGGIAAAVGGVLLTLRKVRSREQAAAEEALNKVEDLLADERSKRIEDERRLHAIELVLIEHGIDPPA
jgi:shikimate 5-dehydrogenase